MIIYDLPFILLHVAVILTLAFLVYIITIKHKKTLHRLFIGITFVVFLWTTIALLQVYFQALYGYSGMILTNLYFSSAGFVSFFLFYIGFIFANSQKTLKPKHYALFLFPVSNAVMIWTNEYHHLYFVKFSEISSEIIRGPYFNIELIIGYSLVLLSIYFLLSFTIKNSGFFSKQSVLIIIGTIVPVFVDVAFVTRLFEFQAYFEPISFSFAVICFMIAIFRFGLLSIVPIALQTVVDHISDSYLVVNERNIIIDFNKTFLEKFQSIVIVTRKASLKDFLEKLDQFSFVKYDGFMETIKEAIETRKSVSFENQYASGSYEKTFTVEVTPIYSQDLHKGTVILFKDITEQRKSFEMIRQTQVMLIESEHMASLGQLVGGIAHNLKTPIMSISGGLVGLSDLIDEYDESVEDDVITAEDHHEIASEMRVWIGKMKDYTAYMSDIISTVKGQAVQLTASTTDSFTLKELTKRVDILMNHELKRYGCKLSVQCSLNMHVEVKGEINSFVQVVNNLIINSIEAYEGKDGVIEFIISRAESEPMIRFEVKDYGSGMSDETKNKLFKEMVTTKAKNGTGLGLYMSYSTITGRFGGKMWFESVYGMGTSFYIMIPAV